MTRSLNQMKENKQESRTKELDKRRKFNAKVKAAATQLVREENAREADLLKLGQQASKRANNKKK